MSSLFDPGLQPERTELAWRRTALSLATGSLIAMRLLPAVFDDIAWGLVGVAGLVASAVIWIVARRRYRLVNAALKRHGDRAELPGAGGLMLLAALVTVTGVISVAILSAAAARS